MNVGRMLLASAAAGMVAPWPISLFLGISWLQSSHPPAPGGAAIIPFIAPLAGLVVGVGLYFPYAFLRRAKGWGFGQDLVLHIAAASAAACWFTLAALDSAHSAVEKLLAVVAACVGVAAVTAPAPILFAFILRRPHSRLQEG